MHAASLDRVLLDWSGALQRAATYLAALGFPKLETETLGRRAVAQALARESHRNAAADTFDELPDVLLANCPVVAPAADSPLSSANAQSTREAAWRSWLAAAWQARGQIKRSLAPATPVAATPPILRGTMTPEDFLGRRLGERRRRNRPRRATEREADADAARELRREARRKWGRRGRVRRIVLGVLVAAPSVVAALAFLGTLPAHSLPVELTLALFFGALFGWILLGFWTAVCGFAVLLWGSDRFAIAPRSAGASSSPIDPACRTALVMPICDEPVARVMAGLRATRASLERAGVADAFDIFIASDSIDPDICCDEEIAWADWQRSAKGGGGIFYRRRKVRLKRKSGNVADFCRRFGRHYRYMVVFDADTVMSGDTLATLVRTMEAHPHVGILQTAPRVVRAATLFARIQQFASGLYGPMFAAGLHFWQLGDSPYWGHNAILRVAPFMRHCALPRLSGSPPSGGDILSHDFVEAALLGRAGWAIWLAYDLPGSYEETPGSMLEEMQRDQRWCQGNLQHLRLLSTEGLASAHRALFLNGVFSYVSAVLWLAFLVASSVDAALWAIRGPDYFATGEALFPTWPVWRPERVTALFAVVMSVLLLPKVLAIGLVVSRGQARAFGGVWALLRGFVLESLASALFAPIRMTFYCRFVLINLMAHSVEWRGGADEQGETTWSQAWRHHGMDTCIAFVWSVCVYALHPAAFWWMAPVAGGLVFSVPLSVLASRRSLGDRARAAGWLATPEETQPPDEIRELEEGLVVRVSHRWEGFHGAVVDPLRNALHAALRRGPRCYAPSVRAARQALVDRAVAGGSDALTDVEKRIVLSDASALRELHERVWRLDDLESERRWALTTER